MRGRLGFVDGGLDDGRELVAAEPGDGAAVAQRRGEPLGHPDQQLVAGGMAQGVVDRLEVVEVQAQHGDGRAVGMPARDGLFQPMHEQRPVGQAGQVVAEASRATSDSRFWLSTRTTNCRASTAATRIPNAASMGSWMALPAACPHPTAAARISGR